MTIYEQALALVPDDSIVGLGSGRAAWAFVGLLGEAIQAGRLRVRGVAASTETTSLAMEHGIPLVGLNAADELSVTVDGADEVDPQLNLIKGYGRALVREKVLAAASRRLIILVGEEKLVPRLGSRGRLPVEVVPFATGFCMGRLTRLGLKPTLWEKDGEPGVSDNGNLILDCAIPPIDDPAGLEEQIRSIPGVVGTGLFLGFPVTALVGQGPRFELIREQSR